MATQVQFRGGTTSEHSSFTGAAREVTVDTTKDTVVIHDGSTAGGFPLAREDASNLKFPDGLVGSPSISFNSDTDTGIYRGGTNILKFVTGATDRLTILANGDVGIGTSPSHDLHVKSDGNTKVKFEGNLNSNTSDLLLSHSSTGDSGLQFNANQLNMFTYGDMTFNAGTGNVSGGYPANERMRIKNTGINVGIGNTFAHSFNAQANQLVVGTGSGDNGITIYSGSGSGDTGNLFFADGFNASDETRAGVVYDHGTNIMNFRVNDAPKVYINSLGNVGINESSPSSLLHIYGSDPKITLEHSNENGTAQIYTQAQSGIILDADPDNTDNGTPIQFNIDGSEVGRFDSGGRFIAPYGVTLGTSAGTYAADNTLDDYEEGGFTPTIGGTATYSRQIGHYTKVGDLCFIHVDVIITAMGTGSLTDLSGLPFTSAGLTGASGHISMSFYQNLYTPTIWVGGYVNNNTDTIYFNGNSSSVQSIGLNRFNVFMNGTRVLFSGVYKVA